MFRHYNRIDVLKLQLLEEPYEKTFVAPYVHFITILYSRIFLQSFLVAVN
jgi:hypothetical protein